MSTELFYEEAGKIVRKVVGKKSSLKTLVYNGQYPNKRKLYALTFSCLKKNTTLQKVLNSVAVQLPIDDGLLAVLCYEILFGKRLGDCVKYRKMIGPYRSRLRSTLKELGDSIQDSSYNGGMPVLPRYVRVNTLLCSEDDVISAFMEEGWEMVTPSEEISFVEAVGGLGPRQFMRDRHVPCVLVFPHCTELHEHKLYTEGKLVLQDKASCLPAFVLNPAPGSTALDCCAAPGNKTTHLAAIMKNSGRIFACDRDEKRLSVLKKVAGRLGARSIHPLHRDALSLSSRDQDVWGASCVLLDPSCSGSGIRSRPDVVEDEEEEIDEKRIQKLAKFQTSLLKHMLDMPRVERVVYSTCSVHVQENEGVVQEALDYTGDRFELADALPGWPHRGLTDNPVGHLCLRASPKDDLTTGFFVALFVRSQPIVPFPGTDGDAGRMEACADGGILGVGEKGSADKGSKAKRKKTKSGGTSMGKTSGKRISLEKPAVKRRTTNGRTRGKKSQFKRPIA